MKGLEILEKYKLCAKELGTYYTKKLITSIEDHKDDLPEDFKEFLVQQGIDNDKIASFIDANPHALFYMFDEQNMIIEIFHDQEKGFSYKFEGIVSSTYWKTRKEAEMNSLLVCFDLLESMLSNQKDAENVNS
jgi:hypothetical protein